MPQNIKYTPLAEPYKRRIGNVTFIVSSFGNQNTSVNAEDMLLDMIKNKILENQSGERTVLLTTVTEVKNLLL